MNAHDQGLDWQASGRTPEFVVVVDFHLDDGAGVETAAHFSRPGDFSEGKSRARPG